VAKKTLPEKRDRWKEWKEFGIELGKVVFFDILPNILPVGRVGRLILKLLRIIK
jgi:hypothetical protein